MSETTENLFDSVTEDKSKNQRKNTEDKSNELDEMKKKLARLEKMLEEKIENERGNPANEWAKKLAQEKANRKAKPVKTLFTSKDGKVLKVDVKPNGQYTSYVGNAVKNKNELKPLIDNWIKEGIWVNEYELESKISEIMKSF